MQRRKFLIGLGSLAAGGAAATGSGAFSAMSASRESDINVTTDGNSLLALSPGSWGGDRVYEADSELKIDFTSSQGGQGVNVNSVYQVGSVKYSGLTGLSEFEDTNGDAVPDSAPSTGGTSPSSNSAFDIMNQDTAPKEVTISWEFDDPASVDGSLLAFGSRADENQGGGTISGGAEEAAMVAQDGTPNPSMSYANGEGLMSGGKIGVSILVDTRDGSTDENLSGSLTISAQTP
jgi:hypothetical protein